jgi:phospholipid transport system substrate-binding protein
MTALRKFWTVCADAVIGAFLLARPARRLVALCLWGLVALVAVQTGTGGSAQAQSVAGASAGGLVEAGAFINSLGQEAITIMASKSEEKGRRVEKYRALLNRGFDLQVIGRFVLGRYWLLASPTQQRDYMTLFEEMVIRSYTLMFDSYNGQTFRVLSSRTEGNGDVIVASEVLQPKGPAVRVEWRVRNREVGPRIIDVVVDGVSMSVTQRQEFASVIQAKGGNMDAFLQALRDKNAAMVNP